MTDLALDAPLAGAVAAKEAGALSRSFGMKTVGDLLAHYPRRYARRGELTPISSLIPGEQATIVAKVLRTSERRMRERRGSILEVVVSDGISELPMTFFNQAWRQAQLRPGARGEFSGKVTVYGRGLQFAHPAYEMFPDEADVAGATEAVAAKARVPLPIYAATASVPSFVLAKAVGAVLDRLGTVVDPLPDEIRAAEGLLTAREALERIHRPQRFEEIDQAIETVRWHEAFLLQTALLQQRAFVRALSGTPRRAGRILAAFDERLPFPRTPDQVEVGARIAADLEGPWPMNRLVQGEVGSGKTLVALRAMLQVAESGGQSALIAPTEVLAGQHLRSITRMLGPDLSAELMPTLLTGQLTTAERRRAALRVASGQSLLVVGTHALLSDKTTFADLGLVVVDEQHRFGVEQRDVLRAKGTAPHALVLTATPIPRTVAMTVFGDLDVSTIRTLPPGRAGIQTFLAPVDDQPQLFLRTFDRAAEEIAAGRQVFVVCPAIDAEGGGEGAGKGAGKGTKKGSAAGGTDASGPDSAGPPPDDGAPALRWGVVQIARALETHPALSGVRTAVLHGKLPSEEKDAIMRAVAAGEVDLLLATTVIEVGVDVPNASMMIVLDADRFGVSQLHQLRGRVGRGEHPGVCILVTGARAGSPARARVEAVVATTDGFELAEVDLAARGEGDVLGRAQSGAQSSLRLLRVVADADLIERARARAERILEEDPALVAHPALAQALSLRMDPEVWAALAKN